LAIAADLTCRAFDIDTGVVCTDAIFADMAFGAVYAVAGVVFTFAVFADVSIWASNTVAGSAFVGFWFAFAVDTDLIVATFDIGARGDALSFAAELSAWAVYIAAGVRLAVAIDALLSVGAASEIAIIVDTCAFKADFIGWAFNQFAWVNAPATHAALTFGAGNL
jgi:hypothetical protein